MAPVPRFRQGSHRAPAVRGQVRNEWLMRMDSEMDCRPQAKLIFT